jgi:hypothetical protein
MIEFLIEAGSDLHATNERGETVFTFSASDPEADSLLRKYGGEAAEGAPTARPEPEEDSWAGLDVVKDQLWSLLSQPRVVRSGRSFDRTELLMALEQLGFHNDYSNLQTLVEESIAQLVAEGKLRKIGNRLAAAS